MELNVRRILMLIAFMAVMGVVSAALSQANTLMHFGDSYINNNASENETCTDDQTHGVLAINATLNLSTYIIRLDNISNESARVTVLYASNGSAFTERVIPVNTTGIIPTPTGGEIQITLHSFVTTTSMNPTTFAVISARYLCPVTCQDDYSFGYLDLGDSIYVGGYRVRLDNIINATNVTNTSAIVSVLDEDGALIRQRVIPVNTTETVRDIWGGEIQITLHSFVTTTSMNPTTFAVISARYLCPVVCQSDADR